MRIASLALLVVACFSPLAPGAEPAPPLLFGTLLTRADRAAGEFAAGVRVVHLELGWNRYEPMDGQVDARYVENAKRQLAAYRAAGMKIVLGTGMQYPPKWASAMPDALYVNQEGVSVPRVLNLTFNPDLRRKAERYLARVASDLGTDFIAVRIGSGGYIECFYPASTEAGTMNSYWAFDANAQKILPMPGWKPGDRTWRGKPVTPADVAQWYDAYLGALVDGIDWQVVTYRRLKFAGDLHVLMPGVGTRPAELRRSIEHYLDNSADRSHTTSRGAVWHEVIARIKQTKGVVVYCSSVADGSGRNDLTQPGDASVDLDDPAVEKWAAARWLAYLADRHHLANSGENPGKGDAPGYGKQMLDAATAQARAANYNMFLWAHDHNLYDGTGPTLAEYGAAIAASAPARKKD